GHGIVESARVLEESGADVLGIGSVEEGIALRKYGIKIPLLVFACNTINNIADIYVEYDLIPTVMYLNQAQAISENAKLSGKIHPIYVKVECGRGRLGINCEEATTVIKDIVKLPNIRLEGIYTHLCD